VVYSVRRDSGENNQHKLGTNYPIGQPSAPEKKINLTTKAFVLILSIKAPAKKRKGPTTAPSSCNESRHCPSLFNGGFFMAKCRVDGGKEDNRI